MLFLFCNILKTVANFANIVIALSNLVLAWYIFVYQKNKDKQDDCSRREKEYRDELKALQLQKQNIRLLWFKELIVQPHLESITDFYKNLQNISQKMSQINDDISDDLRSKISSSIKDEYSILRDSFVYVLKIVNENLYTDMRDNLDSIIDQITKDLFDPNLNFKDPKIYKELCSRISDSRNYLIGKLYNYKGE